jgi:outer membrane receptor protein involved in Fe transport
MIKRYLALFLATVIFVSQSLFSEESITTGTIDVYSSSPLPSIGLPKNMVPANIQTINSNELDAQSGVSIADFMVNNLQGVTVNEIGGNPFQLELNFRGYNATPISGNPQGLSVYIDGIRANQPFSNTVLWDLIPNFSISNMQMVAGSNPVYGLNTLGGAMSMQTKSGQNFKKEVVDVSAGSWARNTSVVEVGGVLADSNMDYYIGFEHFNENGWRKFSPSHVNQIFGKLGFESEMSRYEVTYTGAHNLLIGNGLTPKDLLGAERDGIHTLEDETKNEYSQLALNMSHFFNEESMIAGNIYYKRSDRATYNGDLNDDYCDSTRGDEDECSVESLAAYDADNDDTNLYEGVLNRTNTLQDAFGINLQTTFDQDWYDRRNQIIVGVSAEYSQIKFKQTEQEVKTLALNGFFGGDLQGIEQATGLTGKTKTYGAFVTNTHSLNDRLNINTAIRYNHVQVDNRDTFNGPGSSASLTGKHHFERFNPSIGVTFQPNEILSTYASYSESSRAPTSIELGCANPAQPCNLPTQMADDPPLNQVVAKTLEGGVSGKVTKDTSWNMSIYHAINHDDILFVYANASNGLGYFTNVDETTRKGLDVGVSTKFNKLSLNFNYGFVMAQYGTNFTLVSEVNSSASDDVIQVSDGDYLPNIPKHHLKIRADYEIKPRWNIGATLTAFTESYMMGNENQQHDSSGGLQGEIPGYAVVNLDSQYNFHDNWELHAKVINLFDQDYYSGGRLAQTSVQTDRSFGDERSVASLIPGAPRAGWVGISKSF